MSLGLHTGDVESRFHICFSQDEPQRELTGSLFLVYIEYAIGIFSYVYLRVPDLFIQRKFDILSIYIKFVRLRPKGVSLLVRYSEGIER